jgi:hypothetical protein
MLGSLFALVFIFLGFVAWKTHQAKTEELVPTSTPTPVTVVGEVLVGEATRALASKDYASAASNANDAYKFYTASPGTPPAKMKEVMGLRRKANLALIEDDLKRAGQALEKKDYGSAVDSASAADEVFVKNSDIFKDFKGADKERIEGDRNKASSIQKKAQLMMQDAKKAGIPEPVQTVAPDPGPPPSVDGDGPAYKTNNNHYSGGVHAPNAAPVQQNAPKPKRVQQPVNTYRPRPQNNVPAGHGNAPPGYY